MCFFRNLLFDQDFSSCRGIASAGFRRRRRRAARGFQHGLCKGFLHRRYRVRGNLDPNFFHCVHIEFACADRAPLGLRIVVRVEEYVERVFLSSSGDSFVRGTHHMYYPVDRYCGRTFGQRCHYIDGWDGIGCSACSLRFCSDLPVCARRGQDR